MTMSVSVTVRPGDSYSSPCWMSSKYRRRSAMEDQRIAQGRGPPRDGDGLTPAGSRPRVPPNAIDPSARTREKRLMGDDHNVNRRQFLKTTGAGALAAGVGANIIVPGRA